MVAIGNARKRARYHQRAVPLSLHRERAQNLAPVAERK